MLYFTFSVKKTTAYNLYMDAKLINYLCDIIDTLEQIHIVLLGKRRVVH